jgi:hypothetical protein
MGAWAQRIVETRRQLAGGLTELSKTTGAIEWTQSRLGSIRQPKNRDDWGRPATSPTRALRASAITTSEAGKPRAVPLVRTCQVF